MAFLPTLTTITRFLSSDFIPKLYKTPFLSIAWIFKSVLFIMHLFKLAPIALRPAFSALQRRRQFRLSSMVPQTCRALVIREKGSRKALVVENITVPQLSPRQALVKVAVAAQNPTDVLCFDGGVFGDGSVLGCDFAGTVTAVGSEVTRIQSGDKIAGLIWGGKS